MRHRQFWIGRVLLHPLLLLCYLVVVWFLLTSFKLVSPLLLPSPLRTGETLIDLLQRPAMFNALRITLGETILSYVIATPISIALGAWLAVDKFWGRVFSPILYFFFSIPKSVFLPLFILATGIGVAQKVAYGVFSTIFIVAINTITAVSSIDERYTLVGRCYRSTKLQTAMHIYTPAILPSMIETLRLAMIFNFTGVLLAEIYASKVGIGNLMGTWGQNYQISELIAAVFVVAFIAVCFNETLRALETHYGKWRTIDE